MLVAVTVLTMTVRRTVIFVLGGESDVDRSEKAEHVGLHEHNEGSQDHDRDWYEEHTDAKCDAEEKMVNRHVHHETNRKSDRPNKERKELKRENKGRERRHRAGKVLHVAHAVLFKTPEVEHQEHADCAAKRDVPRGGWRQSGSGRVWAGWSVCGPLKRF